MRHNNTLLIFLLLVKIFLVSRIILPILPGSYRVKAYCTNRIPNFIRISMSSPVIPQLIRSKLEHCMTDIIKFEHALKVCALYSTKITSNNFRCIRK